jgi:phosphate transport system substrate-binding protein
MRKILGIALCAAAICSAALTTACSGEKDGKKYNEGSTVMYADEGFQSFMEEEINVFQYQYNKAYVLPFYTSEDKAIDGFLKDSCNLLITSTPLTKTQIEYMKAHNKKIVRQQEIGVDAVALIVNKDNNLVRLTTTDIRDILTGKVTQWSQLMRLTGEGKADTTAIKVVFDREGSATVNYMQQKFLNGGNFPSNAYAQKSNADVFRIVENDPSTIGIISVSWLGDNLEKRSFKAVEASNINDKTIKELQDEKEQIDQTFSDKIKVLAIGSDKAVYEDDYYQPYQAYIFEKDKYPLVRVIYMVSSASQGTVGHSFYSFVTGFIGQKILARTGILPISVSPRIVEITE